MSCVYFILLFVFKIFLYVLISQIGNGHTLPKKINTVRYHPHSFILYWVHQRWMYSVSLFIDGKALFSPPSLSLLRIHCPCYYYHYHLLLVLAVVTISTITMICYCHIYTACHYYDANIITAITIYQCMRRASTAITVITTDTFILINNHYYVQSLTQYLYWLLSVLFTSLSLSLRHAPSTLSLSLPSMS
jgi:hypothetical protein